MNTDDLFDDKPNSPEDLGFGPAPEKPAEPVKREPKPWDPAHPDHPSQRPENRLEDGEAPPDSWNVATTDLGIEHMRKFLAWCDEKSIDKAGHTVGTLYVGLNAHSLDSFRWLCTQLGRCGFERLPSIVSMSKAILKRDPALLYSDADPGEE